MYNVSLSSEYDQAYVAYVATASPNWNGNSVPKKYKIVYTLGKQDYTSK